MAKFSTGTGSRGDPHFWGGDGFQFGGDGTGIGMDSLTRNGYGVGMSFLLPTSFKIILS